MNQSHAHHVDAFKEMLDTNPSEHLHVVSLKRCLRSQTKANQRLRLLSLSSYENAREAILPRERGCDVVDACVDLKLRLGPANELPYVCYTVC